MRLDIYLSETEMQELQELLCSDIMPETCLDLPGLDGFLAVVALTPGCILPSQWLPWVADPRQGKEAPKFSDAAEAQGSMGLLMRYYNQVVDAIDGGTFKPLYHVRKQEDGSERIDSESWGDGFMLGVKLFADEGWRTVMEEHTELVAPMVMLGTERGRQKLRDSQDPEQAEENARRAVPGAIEALNAHFLPLRLQAPLPVMPPRDPPQRRSEPKVGRNDPCPCGSGKKFKKCCGE